MRTATQNNGLVTIEFERIAPNDAVFRDAIVISQAQYDTLTPAQLQAMEDQRFNAWWEIVSATETEGDQ